MSQKVHVAVDYDLVYMCSTVEYIIYICFCVCMYACECVLFLTWRNAYECIQHIHKCHIWQPYLLFHIYDYLNIIHCLAEIFDFFLSFISITFETVHLHVSFNMCICKQYKFSSDSQKYFTFSSHICSFTCMITYVFLVW